MEVILSSGVVTGPEMEANPIQAYQSTLEVGGFCPIQALVTTAPVTLLSEGTTTREQERVSQGVNQRLRILPSPLLPLGNLNCVSQI